LGNRADMTGTFHSWCSDHPENGIFVLVKIALESHRSKHWLAC